MNRTATAKLAKRRHSPAAVAHSTPPRFADGTQYSSGPEDAAPSIVRLRAQLDPSGRFLNPYLRQILDGVEEAR